MKKSTLASVGFSTLVSVLAVSGVAYAASINATSKLGGSSGDDFEFDGTGRFNSVVIGKQGSGGVTFFNGTIVNGTTTNGNNNPVTFGDNVRIDGRVYRGANAGGGLGDSNPFVINDDAQVAGSLTVGGTDIFAEIDTKADSSDVFGQTGKKLIIPGNRFNPRTDDVDYERSLTAGGSIRLAGGTNEGFSAPIQLPEGSQITGMKIAYLDNQNPQDITVSIISHDVGADTSTTERQVTSSGSAGTFATATASPFTALDIDNMHSYSLHANFPVASVSFKLINVELTYTTPTS